MNMLAINHNRPFLDQLRRVAALEYALIEACQLGGGDYQSEDDAVLASRAGVAQVHMFDLGTALRELGDEGLSYSRCVRQAMLESGTHTEVLRRLEREYQRMLDRTDLPDGLRVLLRANLVEHRGMTPVEGSRLQYAA